MAYFDKFETVEVQEPQRGFQPSSGLQDDWEWRPLDRMKVSLQQSFGSLWAAGSTVADSIGWESASEWAANRAGELFEDAADEELVNIPLSEADSVGDYLQWGVNTVTSFAPDLGLMALGGIGMGTTVSKLALTGAGKKLTKDIARKGLKKNLDKVLKKYSGKVSKRQAFTEATKRTAYEMGAMAGVAGVEGSMQAGQAWLTDLEERGFDANPWAALGVGTASAGITLLSPVNRLLAKGPKGLGKNPATITLGEAGEELGQESILMAHEAGISPDTTLSDIFSSEEGVNRLIESGVAGGLLGGLFGGGSSIIQYRNRKDKNQKDTKDKIIEEPESALETIGIDTTQDASDPLKSPTVQSRLSVSRQADQLAKLFEDRRKSILERKNRERVLAQEREDEAAAARVPEDQFQAYEPELPSPLQQKIRQEERDKRVQEILQEKREARGAEVAQEQQEAARPEVVEQEGKEPYVRGAVATYNTPEGQRRISAAREIASVDWDNLDTNDVLGEETKEKLKAEDTKAKAEAKGEALNSIAESLNAKPEKPTNLAARKEARDAEKNAAETIKAVQEGKIEPPKTFEVTEVPQDVGPDVTEVEPEVFEAQQEAAKAEDKAAGDTVVPRGPVKESYDKGGWSTLKTTVEGKSIPLYINENASIMKTGSNSFEAVVKNEDGDPVRYGTFKRKGDAVSALEQGVDAETFYGTEEETTGTIEAKTDELYKLTVEQEKMYSELPVQKIINKALKPVGLDGDTDAQAAVNEAVLKAIKAFNPEGKKSLADHLKSKVSGAVKDIQKKQSVSIDVEMDEGGTIGDQLTRDSKAEAQDTSLSIERRKAATTKSVEVAGKTIDLVKEGKQWYRAEDTERKKPLGTNVQSVMTDIKEKEAPPVRKVSIEEYQKEKAKESKESKESLKKGSITSTTKVDNTIDTIVEGPTTIRRTKAEVDARFDKEIEDIKNRKKINRTVLERIDTGDKALKFLDALEAIGAVKNLGNKNKLRDINKFILSQAKGKLQGVPLKDRSAFYDDFAEVAEGLESKGKQIPPHFYYRGNIYINKGAIAAEKDPFKAAQLLAHEVVHSVTVEEMRTNKDLRNVVENALETARNTMLTTEELKLLKNKYKNSPNVLNGMIGEAKQDFTRMPLETYYALLDINEFVSEAFVNPDLQQRMRQIPVEKPKGFVRNLWDKFISIIAKPFGIDPKRYSLLSEVITAGTALMRTNAKGDIDLSLTPALAATADVKVPKEKKKKKTWEERQKVMLEKTAKGKPEVWLKKAGDSLASSVRDLGKSMTEVLRKANRRLIRPVRKMEMKINEKNVDYQRRIKPFFDGYQNLSREDKLMLDLTLANYNKEDYRKKAHEVLKRTGLEKSFSSVRSVLKEIYRKKEVVGLNHYNATENYFPRRVKDITGLMQSMKNDPSYGAIQATIDSLGPKASKHDKEKAIMSMMNTGKMPPLAFLDPTSSRKRSIDTVSSDWIHHYDNAADALINHIYESNENIYTREFFGDVGRVELVKKRDALIKELEEKEDMKPKVREGKVAKLKQMEDALDNTELEFTVGVSNVLGEIAPGLEPEQQDQVIRAIRARLLQKGMHGTWANLRNMSLMSVLGSPTSAITQIGDLAFSAYNYGLTETAGSVTRTLLGDQIITPKDLDLSHSMKEFQSEGTAKWLDKTLKWSGLQFMDQFGKTTTMNAALSKAKKMEWEEFRDKYADVLWEDTRETFKDIKDGKNTELTRFFAFNELSNMQPVSLSEMPIGYLLAGNMRIFYALKSYNIKAINTLYRELVHNWRTATDAKGKAKAAKDTGRLLLLMTVAGATADELKDLLLGKDAGTLSDTFYDNLMKTALLSRYTLDKGWREGDIFGTLFGDLLLPPGQFATAPIKDVASLFTDEPDFTTLKYLPYGKLPYSWFSPTEEGKDQRRLRQDLMDAYKKGASYSSIRGRLNQYNAWARKNDESLLTLSNLNKARSKYRKENR